MCINNRVFPACSVCKEEWKQHHSGTRLFNFYSKDALMFPLDDLLTTQSGGQKCHNHCVLNYHTTVYMKLRWPRHVYIHKFIFTVHLLEDTQPLELCRGSSFFSASLWAWSWVEKYLATWLKALLQEIQKLGVLSRDDCMHVVLEPRTKTLAPCENTWRLSLGSCEKEQQSHSYTMYIW